jgi:hypothetical protein
LNPAISRAWINDGAARPDSVHEIEHDGYRLIVRRQNGILKTF